MLGGWPAIAVLLRERAVKQNMCDVGKVPEVKPTRRRQGPCRGPAGEGRNGSRVGKEAIGKAMRVARSLSWAVLLLPAEGLAERTTRDADANERERKRRGNEWTESQSR